MKINKNKLINDYLSKSHDFVEIISENNQELIVKILLMEKVKKEPTIRELLKQIQSDVSNIKTRLETLEREAIKNRWDLSSNKK